MIDLVTLYCPSCGGALKMPNTIERLACAYCGNEHMVNRGGGIVTLSPVVEALDTIRVSTDKTASELAIKRLQQEIRETGREASRLRDNPASDKAYRKDFEDYQKRDLSGLKRMRIRLPDQRLFVNTLTIKDLDVMIAYFRRNAKHERTMEALTRLRRVEYDLLNKRAQLAKHRGIVDQV